jgi:hypothetical protein
MDNWISVWSSFLFARASAIEGMARAIDLGGTLQTYNYSRNNQEADSSALYADWRAIGDDLIRTTADISEQAQVQISDDILEKAKAMLCSAAAQSNLGLLEEPKG